MTEEQPSKKVTGKMYRIYIAGAYSAADVLSVFANMRRGMNVAYTVLKAGYAPFVPWFDYHFSLMGPMELNEYYAYSLAWLEASDAILVVEGWENSKGTKNEIERAKALNIPVFFNLEELQKAFEDGPV
jgi:hypothetical protein